jgi:hypothetical protein
MDLLNNIVQWHIDHQDYINLFKDLLFAIGVIATFYGYFKFLKFLARRKTLNKKQEMENDLKLYEAIHKRLKEYVDDYDAKPNNLRDIGIRLLYMKNYPYNLDKDGFPEMLYYYFMSEHHKASGYISGKGLYVLEHLWFLSQAIYYNPKNEKWFIDDKGKKFKHYKQLKHKQLVKRIPFSNIYGYDFNSDWADKNEPVFYTKYKYYKWKLFADDMDAVTIDQEYHLAYKVHLNKKKRARRIRTYLRGRKNRIRSYFLGRKHRKLMKAKKAK